MVRSVEKNFLIVCGGGEPSPNRVNTRKLMPAKVYDE